jgi:chorismate--pyruvate lyase
VTRLLEAYADEPIEVVKLVQAFAPADAGDASLGLAPGDRVLRRRVLLRGRHSGRTLLYAEADVVAEHVHPAVLEGLVETDLPIGVLLDANRTETFREILSVDREPAGRVGVHFGTDPTADVFARTYVIVAGGQPIVRITEKFPVAGFGDLQP